MNNLHRKKTVFSLIGKKGFTLMELVVVMVVVGVLSVTIAPFIKVNIDSYIQVRNGKDAMQAARIALNRMIEEIKRIPSPNNFIGGYSTSISFRMSDGVRITYKFNSSYGTITRRRGGFFSDYIVLLKGVRAFNLTYFGDDGRASSSAPSDIRRIKIEINLGTDQQNFTLSKEVTPRSF